MDLVDLVDLVDEPAWQFSSITGREWFCYRRPRWVAMTGFFATMTGLVTMTDFDYYNGLIRAAACVGWQGGWRYVACPGCIATASKRF